jgi:succinate dehydrogenase flavin-adding protein (antitoxin of CptAB toxin-antitoxin module)
MAFEDHLKDITAAELVEILNCPLPTAYDWKSGRRKPPEWQQVHWLNLIEAATKGRKATSPGRKGKAK